jgi:hypothetical protein
MFSEILGVKPGYCYSSERMRRAFPRKVHEAKCNVNSRSLQPSKTDRRRMYIDVGEGSQRFSLKHVRFLRFIYTKDSTLLTII